VKAAARPCVDSTCRHLQPCPLHGRPRRREPSARLRRQTEPWRALYDTTRWQRLRRALLAAEPLCRACAAEDRLVLATVVDHRVPHRGDVARFYDTDNLQPLCATCHGTKTAAETLHAGRAAAPTASTTDAGGGASISTTGRATTTRPPLARENAK
jgi:5-methylcytosine-specific restriction enzyme A